jgi:serine phosphatase RsbU (regulator of sigma subunit)
MRTATEVGGDYYDYIFAKDGTLHIAIGDATGHGTKAGLMVATVKSLFNSIGTNMMIQDFFARCTEILKKMNLGNLFMSMTLLRIKNKYLIASTAGMPPMMIYKKSQNRVDEHTLKGMPLGAFEGFEYSEMELELESGDVILLMSDGLIELFNEKMEMFGEKRIEELLKINHDKSSDEIVQIFYNEADKWSGDKPQDDDMTFIVIKILE